MDILQGKHLFGIVKVGPKGQIVIPAEARKTFGISSGDSLVMVGDEASGLALLTNKELIAFFGEIIKKAPAGVTDAAEIERASGKLTDEAQ